MTRLFKYLLAIIMLTGFIAQAQSVRSIPVVATITATATVVGNVDLIIMKDMDFELSSLSPADLTVNPQDDSRAGQMKIVESPIDGFRTASIASARKLNWCVSNHGNEGGMILSDSESRLFSMVFTSRKCLVLSKVVTVVTPVLARIVEITARMRWLSILFSSIFEPEIDEE